MDAGCFILFLYHKSFLHYTLPNFCSSTAPPFISIGPMGCNRYVHYTVLKYLQYSVVRILQLLSIVLVHRRDYSEARSSLQMRRRGGALTVFSKFSKEKFQLSKIGVFCIRTNFCKQTHFAKPKMSYTAESLCYLYSRK